MYLRFFSYVILFGYLLACNKKNTDTSKFGQNNALWVQSVFLRGYKPSTGEKLTDSTIYTFVDNLKKNRIKYIYLFAGPFEKDGHLPKYPFSKIAINSVEKIRKLYPELIILPWVGGIQNKTVYLNEPSWVKNALMDTKKLIDVLNVKGVHVDFEYILKGDKYLDTEINQEGVSDIKLYGPNVNEFHRKLKVLLPNIFVSSVVVSTAPDTKPWKRKTTIEELKILSKYVNQISFLFYDTKIKEQSVFERNFLHQLRDFKKLKEFNSKVDLLVGLGTFINREELRIYRDMKVENLENSFDVIKKTIVNNESKQILVDGIAIFCDWETSPEEWGLISNKWIYAPQ